MMKKSAFILLCALLSLAFILQGCVTPPQSTTETPSGEQPSSENTAALSSATVQSPSSEVPPTEPTASETGGETTSTSPEPVEIVRSSVSLSEEELLDKLEGGWIGQMVGVTWGAPTEFVYAATIMPASSMPVWRPELINDGFGQDDCYVEIPFLDAMKQKGAFCSPTVIAQKFRNSTFALWHANGRGRENLKAGISFPDSGSYLYNEHCEDIDWQIECDFLGMMYPGQVNEAAKRAFELGHIMNYGDGVYGGVFVTAMHAAAFTAKSVDEIIEAGVSVIPKGTEFRSLIDDVINNYQEGLTFERNWAMIQAKWAPYDICPELAGDSNIDAKLNSGYILLGLLYGEGDLAKTILISTRCGQDSDCNPSSAASILGNFYGASGIEDQYKSALDKTGTRFATTNYTFNGVMELNLSLMKEVLTEYGAKEENGVWTFDKDDTYAPVAFEQTPDGIYACFTARLTGNTVYFTELVPFGKNEKVTGFVIDTGDGTTFDNVLPAEYVYAKAGKYQLTLTLKGDKGSENKIVRKMNVRKDYAETLPEFYIVCSVQSPMGSGSKRISTICDGVIPGANAASSAQYDTYILCDPHGVPDVFAYAGYVYKEAKTVSSVSFTEGMHFGNGGWFKDGTLHIEVFIDGEWKEVSCSLSKPYPKGNSMSAFGDPFETYVFTLETPVEAQGVRIAGLAGGRAGFISIAELSVG